VAGVSLLELLLPSDAVDDVGAEPPMLEPASVAPDPRFVLVLVPPP
jgi:hypothetical protein